MFRQYTANFRIATVQHGILLPLLRGVTLVVISRESEVLASVARGLNNRQIGEALGISENSVKMHLKRCFYKLNVSDRSEAVTVALQRGYIH